MSRAIEVGDIFATKYADFFQVVRATAKTVTVRPIASRFVRHIDYWEREYLPVPGEFANYPSWSRETCEKGRRCTVRDYSAAKDMPQIKVDDYEVAYLWDGRPSVLDTYN